MPARRRQKTKGRSAVSAYPPRQPVDPDQLARTVCCSIDGGIIMSKALGQPKVLPEQMLMARSYIKLLFSPAAEARAAA